MMSYESTNPERERERTRETREGERRDIYIEREIGIEKEGERNIKLELHSR